MQEIEAVVDRIEDCKRVVLLVGPTETEWIVPLGQLPHGIREGIWLRIIREGDHLVQAVIDTQKTEQTRSRIEAKLNQLRQRRRPSP